MVSSRDSHIIELWLERQPVRTREIVTAATLSIFSYSTKLLTDKAYQHARIRSVASGGGPGNHPLARTLAAIKSLFGFCQRGPYIAPPTLPPSSRCQTIEHRLAERIVGACPVEKYASTVKAYGFSNLFRAILQFWSCFSIQIDGLADVFSAIFRKCQLSEPNTFGEVSGAPPLPFDARCCRRPIPHRCSPHGSVLVGFDA
jgi:hypothetical protein